MQKCDVRIEDKHFHELHHALGCPWPDEVLGETYRNYFAASPNSNTADRMRASPHWTNGTEKFGMVYFHVTKAGQRALVDHMRSNLVIPARYAITFRHHDGCSIVSAQSRSAAKYAAYIDADIDWPFMEYAAEIKSVRLFAPANVPKHSS
ncbi:hypothetical protein [Pseudooceanicola sp. MF1-13]|uniref:hypothetical protein n=1 Tax=Pseudooceanicola sp. MF1-13 TaxID=3379095 RepID=UPI003892B5F6